MHHFYFFLTMPFYLQLGREIKHELSLPCLLKSRFLINKIYIPAVPDGNIIDTGDDGHLALLHWYNLTCVLLGEANCGLALKAANFAFDIFMFLWYTKSMNYPLKERIGKPDLFVG